MKTIDEWVEKKIWGKIGLRDILRDIRAEAFEAAIGAIDACAFRGKDHKLRSTITFIDAIRVIKQLGEESHEGHYVVANRIWGDADISLWFTGGLLFLWPMKEEI